MIQLLFVLINIAIAWWHSRLIKQNRPIVHSLWAFGYLVAVVIATMITQDWFLFFLLFLERKLVFDMALNVFRGKPILYVSATTTSVLDRWQRSIWALDGRVPAMMLAGAILLLNLLRLIF